MKGKKISGRKKVKIAGSLFITVFVALRGGSLGLSVVLVHSRAFPVCGGGMERQTEGTLPSLTSFSLSNVNSNAKQTNGLEKNHASPYATTPQQTTMGSFSSGQHCSPIKPIHAAFFYHFLALEKVNIP